MNKLRKFLGVLIIALTASFEGFCLDPISFSDIAKPYLILAPGSPTLKPVPLSFGFVSVEDGRFLACYSKTGQDLWLTKIGRIKSVSVNESDFIFVVTTSGELVLVNPSGTVLWRKYLDFTPEREALPTKEGRIYVSSRTNLASVGIGGILKWSLETEPQDEIDPVVLSDQSVLVFLKRTESSKTCAVRYSMYGEVIEEIVFQGNVINRFSVPDGLVLVFSDGTIGKMTINKDLQTVSSWKNNDFYANKHTMSLLMNDSDLVLVTPDKKLDIINLKDGKVKKTFKIKEIGGHVSSVYSVDSKFILTGEFSCVVYSESGEVLYHYLLPEKNEKCQWLYTIFLDNGLIYFLCEDWVINVYKVLATSKEKDAVSSYDMLCPVNQYFDTHSFDCSGGIYKKNYHKLMDDIKLGNYGSKEIEITEICISAINSQVERNNTFERNLSNEIITDDTLSLYDYENIFKLFAVLQNSTLQKTLIGIIDSETDPLILANALEALSECPYDPDGRMLDSLQSLIRRTNPNDKQVLINAANLAYEISHFMGKPAFSAKGKHILGELFGPQYDYKIKQFVRSLYQKLADNK